MKNLLILCALLSVAQNTAYSAEAHKKTKTTTTVVETPAAAPVASTESSYSGDAQFNVTGSIGAIDSQLFYGPGFQLEWPVTIDGSHFAFGFETHFFYSSRSDTVGAVTAKSKAWTIPIFFTGKYLFQNNISFIKPYLALSVGPTIDHVSGDAIVSGVSIPASDTTVRFGFTIRPGMTLGNSQKWFVEVPFGLLLKEFAILPTIGYHF